MAAQDFAQIEVPQVEVEKPLTHVKTMVLTVLSVLLVLGTFMGGYWLGQKQGIETASGEDKASLEKLLKEQQNEMNLLRQEAAKKKVQHKVSTTQVGDLTFYNELPQQSVQPSPLHATGESKNTGAAKKNIQTRSNTADALSPSTLEIRKMIEQEIRQSPQKEAQKTAQKTAKVAVPKLTTKPASMNDATPKLQSFILQVSSFQKRVDADAFLPKLTKRGFSPLVKRVELPNLGTWYRVYITGYDSIEAANQAKKSVKKSLNITALVLKAG